MAIDFLEHAANLTDDELERELESAHSAQFDEFIESKDISDGLKEHFLTHRREVEQEYKFRNDRK